MNNLDRKKTPEQGEERSILGRRWRVHPRRLRTLRSFALSVMLLSLTAILYRIPFVHAGGLQSKIYSSKISAIDDKIPVVPQFLFGYVWSYFYWFFAPFFIVLTGQKKTVEFFFTYVITLLFCSLIMYFFPTKIDRVAEGLWNPANDTVWWKLLRICYKVDGGNVSYNLLPSMHCANCVLYYQAMRNDKIPLGFRLGALASTLLVIASTLLTKQHFFMDAVTGVTIPILVRPAAKRIARIFQPLIPAEEG